MIIEINSRYYLAPTTSAPFVKPHDFDVYDRAKELCFLPAVVFSNGSESECREWVLRNTEEPVEHTKGEWKPETGRTSYFGMEKFLEDNPGAVVINMPAPPFAIGCCGAIVLGRNVKGNATLIATAPKLLALLEQYHAAMPTKESGALIAEAKGWL